MKSIFLLLSLALALLVSRAAEPANAQRLRDWQAMRFGMFIHWGPVSLEGTEIGWSRGDQVPIGEYDQLYTRFNPTNFDARAWVQTAKDAGMKYLVFTTKHHDGFCMWDTRQTDFNIMRSPWGRDAVKELAVACRRQGIAFGAYHSVCDWHHPDFPLTSPGGRVRRPVANLDRYEQYLRAQVKELITQYGPLLLMWFDVPQEFDSRRGLGLEQWTRALQPDIIVNDRSGASGDYATPEQTVGGFRMDRPWETCMTLCQQWAWKPGDAMKSLEQCVQTLVRCAGADGNLLLNVGPTSAGIIEPRQVQRLREMGAWLRENGESIYGTRGGPYKPTRTLASTRQGHYIYLHLLGGRDESIELPDFGRQVISARILGGSKIQARQAQGQLALQVPAEARRPYDTIIKLRLSESAMSIPPLTVPRKNGLSATASNVYQGLSEYAPESAVDDDPNTRWATDAGTHQAWIALAFTQPQTVHGLRVQEAIAERVQKFQFQYRTGTEWKTVFTGTRLGRQFERQFSPVNAREFRLEILEATEGPTLAEIELLRN